MIVTAAYVGPPFPPELPTMPASATPLGDATSDNISSGVTVIAVLAFAALAFGIVNLGKKKHR